MNDDENVLEAMEIDLDVAGIGELLEKHGIPPTPELVHALWEWKESRLAVGREITS